MKKVYFIIVSFLMTSVCIAQPTDSVKLAQMEQQLVSLDSVVLRHKTLYDELNNTVQALSVSVDTIQPGLDVKLDEVGNMLTSQQVTLDALEKQVETLQTSFNQIKSQLDNLGGKVDANAQHIVSASSELDAKIAETDNNAKAQATELSMRADGVEQSIKSKSTLGLVVLVAVFAILLMVSILLHLKGKKGIEALKESAEKLNEEIIGKASVEVSEMQKIANSIGSLSAAGASAESEQQLIKTLADRITFMEMTLYKMDSSVRGHKQLSKSISQMKDNMLANGYEIVDMLGKAYHEGMKVIANFVENEELELGKQIITGIIKPQINYKGKMIQAAQITVSQNL
ncbi:MAG: hypothetical protein II344_05775 [Bacteroidales bacterium]|nr:hypothetical protein [Bacteroidales bacterium]